MTEKPPARDLGRITLSVLAIGVMIAASLWVLSPFLAATVWAAMIVVATWPMMLAVQARLGGRRWLAVTVMTTTMLLVLVVPLTLAVATIVDHADDIVDWSKDLASATVPSPPAWVGELPLVGPKLAGEWAKLAATSREDLAVEAAPYARKMVQWFAGQAGGFGLTVLHFLLTLIVTAILYATGETAALGVRRFARKLAAERGDSLVVLAGQAIRAVALGVVVTAIVQSLAAGLGLAVSGVPYATVLTAIIFMLCIAQLGPILVLAPAVGWLYWTGDVVWGTVLLVWTVLVGLLDNVLRPVLIKRGADLPLLLIFAGVIGGLISLGIIGLFVGPVVLAVTYRLLESWVGDIDHEESAPPVSGAVSAAMATGEPLGQAAGAAERISAQGKGGFVMRFTSALLLFVAVLAAMPAFAQSKPAVDRSIDNMQYLREKLLLDKKQVVAANMELTESEAKGFWPLYEEYQKELNGINDRLATMIVSYSKELNAGSLTDQKAKQLVERYIAIEDAEVKMKRSFAGRLARVLPGRKVARYLQIENKIRAIVRYEIAAEVPLLR